MQGQRKFPRQERLTRKRDYEWMYQHGTKWVGREFVCFVARREGQGRKIGIAVSRKVGKAVVRNRVKRRIREVYRNHRTTIGDDVSVVVVARVGAAKLDYHGCEEAIRRLLRKGNASSA